VPVNHVTYPLFIPITIADRGSTYNETGGEGTGEYAVERCTTEVAGHGGRRGTYGETGVKVQKE